MAAEAEAAREARAKVKLISLSITPYKHYLFISCSKYCNEAKKQ